MAVSIDVPALCQSIVSSPPRCLAISDAGTAGDEAAPVALDDVAAVEAPGVDAPGVEAPDVEAPDAEAPDDAASDDVDVLEPPEQAASTIAAATVPPATTNFVDFMGYLSRRKIKR